MLAFLALPALLLSAAPADGPLASLVAQLDRGSCDDAFALVSQVAVPDPADPDLVHAARAVARGASRCKSDPAVALAFTGLAARLAPDDPTVLLAQAQMLAALKQWGEASEVLDRIIARHPDSFAEARLMRGRIAVKEADWDLAVRLLTPLAGDPALGAEAGPLLEKSRAGQLDQRADDEKMAQLRKESAEAKAKEKAPPENKGSAEPSRAMQIARESGMLIGSYSGKVSLGGSKTFTVRGLKKDRTYVFRASGECSRTAKRSSGRRRRGALSEDPDRSIFGVDFAVQLGQQEPRALSAGQGKREQAEVEFTADAESMQVRVFDRSEVDKNVKCTVSEFSVVAR